MSILCKINYGTLCLTPVWNIKGDTVLQSILVTFGLPIAVQSLNYILNYQLYTPIYVCCIPLRRQHMHLGTHVLSLFIVRG